MTLHEWLYDLPLTWLRLTWLRLKIRWQRAYNARLTAQNILLRQHLAEREGEQRHLWQEIDEQERSERR